jgi:hypothetical protein
MLLRSTLLPTTALAAALFTAACASQHEPFMKVEPIDQYRAYGEYHPQAQDDAIVAQAATADPTGKTIHVFQEALPPGIEMGANTLGVAPGYKHKLLGKYAYSAGKEVSKDELVLRVKKMCVATGANAAIILFQLVPNDHQDQAQAIEAVLAVVDESVLPK